MQNINYNKNMKLDLHIHTNFSDGGKTVQEIFDIAQKNNVKVLSITDHNNIDAYNEIKNINSYGIKIIRGIEADVLLDGQALHLLMYNYSLSDAMKNYLQKCKEYDIKEFERMILACEEICGTKFDRQVVDQFIKNNQYFDKVKLNNLLVDLKIAPTPADAFYQITKNVEDKKRYKISAKEIFEIAKASGAQTFLAHPIKYLKDMITFDNLKQVILKLKDLGLDGVEVYNNRQTKQQEQELLCFIKSNDLLTSAGSDFHAKIGAKETKEIGKVLGEDILDTMIAPSLLKVVV